MVLLALSIGNALLLVFLLGGWFVDLIYALPGFPAPDIALDDSARRELAADGMAAIRPLGPGVELLRQAQLPSGLDAFSGREIEHMEDVRKVVTGFAIAWLCGLGIVASTWFTLGRRDGGTVPSTATAVAPPALRRAVRDASWALLGLIAVVGLALLLAFDPVFEAFHALFFSGDSWRFRHDDTLLQLYPELFWAAAGTVIVLLVVAQCLALIRRLR